MMGSFSSSFFKDTGDISQDERDSRTNVLTCSPHISCIVGASKAERRFHPGYVKANTVQAVLLCDDRHLCLPHRFRCRYVHTAQSVMHRSKSPRTKEGQVRSKGVGLMS